MYRGAPLTHRDTRHPADEARIIQGMEASTTTPRRLLSAPEVAAMFSVSPRWVYRRALTGELPFAHLLPDSPRSPLRVEASAIDEWIATVFEREDAKQRARPGRRLPRAEV